MARLDIRNPSALPPGRYTVVEAQPSAFLTRKKGLKMLGTRPLNRGEVFDVPPTQDRKVLWVASDCCLEVA